MSAFTVRHALADPQPDKPYQRHRYTVCGEWKTLYYVQQTANLAVNCYHCLKCIEQPCQEPRLEAWRVARLLRAMALWHDRFCESYDCCWTAEHSLEYEHAAAVLEQLATGEAA